MAASDGSTLAKLHRKFYDYRHRLVRDFDLARRIPEADRLLRSARVVDIQNGLSAMEAFTLTGIDLLLPGSIHIPGCPFYDRRAIFGGSRYLLAPFARSVECLMCGREEVMRREFGWLVSPSSGVPQAQGYTTIYRAALCPDEYKEALHHYHNLRDQLHKVIEAISLYPPTQNSACIRGYSGQRINGIEIGWYDYRPSPPTSPLSSPLPLSPFSPPFVPSSIPPMNPPKYEEVDQNSISPHHLASLPTFSPPSEPPSPSEREEVLEYVEIL